MNKCKVQLHGGIEDGFEGYKPIIDLPGKFPLLEVKGATRNRRYIYQARSFLDGKPDDTPLVMDFIQILNREDEL